MDFNKQKYLIKYPNSELFGFAGLYDHWVNKKLERL
jgi:putative SOS response-associated peptidase YedK